MNMQKSALELGAGGQSQFVKNRERMRRRLKEKRKKRCLARAAASRRNASPIFHKFSGRASPRVAGLRRAGTSKVWGARRRRNLMKARGRVRLRRLALPKLESAHSKIETRKSKLAKPRAKRRSDQEATSLCSHGPFSIAVSRSAASVN